MMEQGKRKANREPYICNCKLVNRIRNVRSGLVGTRGYVGA